MTDAAPGDQTNLFPGSVGERLRAARDVAGLSLAEVAARTRVPQRHLEAIESGNYGALPSPTYAMGFVRAYARTVDADEVSLARDARVEVDRVGRPTPHYQPYEIADPNRVPSRGLVIVAAGLGLAIVVLAILWFATGLGRGGNATPTPDTPSVAVAVPAAQPSATPKPTGGQVTLTATDEVWLRVYDADDKSLYLGTMKPGEKFDVPLDAKNPKINVGRPDKLTVTLNGSSIPPLGDGKRPLSGIGVSGDAIAARLAGQGSPATAANTLPAPIGNGQ